jgi:hypothetical protein
MSSPSFTRLSRRSGVTNDSFISPSVTLRLFFAF